MKWKIPLTYSVAGSELAGQRFDVVENDGTGRCSSLGARVKLNVEGAGNYRVQYDDRRGNCSSRSWPG